MVDPIAATGTLFSSLTAVSTLTKSFIALKGEAERQAMVIELQQAIIGAQDAALRVQSELAAERERSRFLAERIREHDDWAAEVEKYELFEAGLGRRLYRLRTGDDGRLLCPNCMGDRKLSILQPMGMEGVFQWCPKCDSKFQTRHTSGHGFA